LIALRQISLVIMRCAECTDLDLPVVLWRQKHPTAG